MSELIREGDACKIHCCGRTYKAAYDYTPKSRALRSGGVWHIQGPCFPCLLRGELGVELAKHGILVVTPEVPL